MPYYLENSSGLTGARVSYFDINKFTLELEEAGLAYDAIFNRAGLEINLTDAETENDLDTVNPQGINRLCSAQLFEAHQFGDGIGLEDRLFFTGEETDGGTEFVLDPATNTLYAVPAMGRAGWESVTELNTGVEDKVAFLIGDDRAGKYLLMYVGEKGEGEGPELLVENGLAQGTLYAWVADAGSSPENFNGTGESAGGTWVELDYYRPDLAGNGDYDLEGWATQEKQDALADAAGAFQFSRPEDVSTNPQDGTQAVLASTGRGQLFPSDNWGTTYIIDTEFDSDGNPLTATASILYDGDDAGGGQFSNSDFGIRSPDNLDWADNGLIYIQEDRSTAPGSLFGGTSGEEASIWELDPITGEARRIAQINRHAALPGGQTDEAPTDLGNWESSGILDVSELFDQKPGSLFIFDVQAHSVEDGSVASQDLVEGGQLAFLLNPQSSFWGSVQASDNSSLAF